MISRPVHSHTDLDTLTVGCPACIERVQHDQQRAALRDAPVRRCTWKFEVGDKTYRFTLDVKVPAGWEPWQVDEEYAVDTGVPISDALGDAEDSNGAAFYEVCHTIRCVSIGAVVAPAATANVGQESLL